MCTLVQNCPRMLNSAVKPSDSSPIPQHMWQHTWQHCSKIYLTSMTSYVFLWIYV